jgi:hypothetical protein
LLRELAPEKPSNGHAKTLADGEQIAEGGRHTLLVSLGGTMRRRGMSEASIEAALLAENQERCDPPLDEEEVRGIAKRIARYEPAEPTEKVRQSAVPLSWKPFPVKELPEPADEYVHAAAQAIGCDPCLVALPLLGGLSAAVGNTRRIVLKRAWSEPALLWLATVAESGELKSPAAEAPLLPIMARQASGIQKHKEAEKKYESSHLQYEAEVNEWKKKKKADRGEPPERPERPVCARYWCSDITIEALGNRLLEAPRGVLVFRDELSGWLRSFDCYRQGRGGDVAHWLSLRAARSMLVDRKSGEPRTLFVPRAFAAICGGIQPAILARVLGQEHFEDGLCARLLFGMPPRKTKRWSEFDLEPQVMSALAKLYDGLYSLNMRPTEEGGIKEPVPVPLSPAAKRVWVEFYNTHGMEQAELTGDLCSAWSKLEGYAARLALVFHCCRVARGTVDPGTIDERSMKSGIEMSNWFANEAMRVYAAMTLTSEEKEQDELVQLIQKRGGSITARQLMNASRRYRSSVDLAERALNGLVTAGLAVRTTTEPGPDGGRPTCVWRLA